MTEIKFKAELTISRVIFPGIEVQPKIGKAIVFTGSLELIEMLMDDNTMKDNFNQWLELNSEDFMTRIKRALKEMVDEYKNKFEFEKREPMEERD